MKVLDPGHLYRFNLLDEDSYPGKIREDGVRFVKREGENYPGNKGIYPGTTLQEVLRACTDRLRYVNGQIRSHWNDDALGHLREAIRLLEQRAAERHGRSTDISLDEAEFGECCKKCNHVGCEGGCH